MYSLAKNRLDEVMTALKTENKITTLVSGIFYNIPANQPYPIIHFNNISLKNYGVKNTSSTEVIFELAIYTKANDFERLNRLSEKVLKTLRKERDLIIGNSKIELCSKTNIYENKMILKFIINEEK